MKTIQALCTIMLSMAYAGVASAQDGFEPDNSHLQANNLANGEIQTHTIFPSGDADYVRITVTGSGASDFRVESNFGTELAMADSSLIPIGSGAGNGPGGSSVISFPFLAPGIYYVQVLDQEGGEINGYQVSCTWTAPPAADAYEPDNSSATAKPIASGVAQNRTIHAVGDTDLAKFTAGGAGARNVRIAASSGTQIWLIQGGTGDSYGYEYTSGLGMDTTINRSTLPAGTYFIKVKKNGNDGTMAYQLFASWEAAPTPAADAYEPDNRWSAAKRIRNGRTQRRTIHAVGNRDWARIDIGGSGARDLHIRTSGLDGDTQMWLYGSERNRLAYDNDSGPGRFSRIRVPLIMPGTYYIRVQEKGNNGMIPSYRLKASWTPI